MSASEAWTGRTGFILATIGSAVGIGSIWKFPYEVGANGGSAFLLFYLLGLVGVVVPLMFAEFAIGRRGRGDPVASIARLAASFGADRRWRFVGALGVLTGFLILTFYSVIGGWTLGYAWQTAVEGLAGQSADAARLRFEAFLAEPVQMIAFHGVFMASTAFVIARGVTHGIETASKILMPVLAALMLALAGYAIVEGDLDATVRFLFKLEPERITADAVISALGLGFFSIGVGLGLMITYAAYAGAQVRLTQVAIVSVFADTAISLAAGFAVFPIVFAHGLDPGSGPGMVFVTLPLAFARMPLGTVAAFAFFALLFVAALASAISLLELVVAMLTRRYRWSRLRATLLATGRLLRRRHPHGALVQPVGAVAPARGGAGARAPDLLRPARRPDLEPDAAGRRIRARAVRRMGDARARDRGRVADAAQGRVGAAVHAALPGAGRNRAGGSGAAPAGRLSRARLCLRP